ncbi:hypothetical protein A4A49_60207 [Nicotiana attenuata]|uniref:Uncharacterized protein n=1 Tax=Nicotiana attenuata TaxID=49451 RepID=A0A1J6JH18_NICAT|nr:hypothetical protein A4A49_60207 [Nicotiana attenuata]
MNQEGCSSKNKKISNRIPAGSLASLRNQKVSSLTTKRISQAIRSNKNEKTIRISITCIFAKSIKVPQRSQLQEKVRQVPLISTSSTAQGVQEQVRQVPMDSITPTSQAVHEPSEDSTDHEAIEQSEEPGKYI